MNQSSDDQNNGTHVASNATVAPLCIFAGRFHIKQEHWPDTED